MNSLPLMWETSENLEFDEYYAIVHHINQGDWYIKKNTLFVDVMKKYPVQLKIYENPE